MTHPLSGMALFCEDIREEKQGSTTIVGVTPDNVVMPQALPCGFPKLGIFARVNFDPSVDPGPLRLILRNPGGDQDLATFTPELIEKARTQARDTGNPVAGIIASTVTAGFMVFKACRLTVILQSDGAELIIGSINVSGGDASDPNALQRPSEQSQSDALGTAKRRGRPRRASQARKPKK